MAHQHASAVAIHIVFYFLLYPFWRKLSLFTVGLSILIPLFDIDGIVLGVKNGNITFVSSGAMIITCAFLITYMSKDKQFKIAGKSLIR